MFITGLFNRIEKYRPTNLSEVSGNKETISRLKVVDSMVDKFYGGSCICHYRCFQKKEMFPISL